MRLKTIRAVLRRLFKKGTNIPEDDKDVAMPPETDLQWTIDVPESQGEADKARMETIFNLTVDGDTVWIDGEEPEGEDSEDVEDTEPLPMFREGDSLMLYNPYTNEFVTDSWGYVGEVEEPEMFVVEKVRYDADESVFRYRLQDYPGWVSEEWLSLRPVSRFISIDDEIYDMSVGVGKATPDLLDDLYEAAESAMDKIEYKAITDAMDDMARQATIDRCLDVILSGTESEKGEAMRLLGELTAEGGSE